MAQFLPLPLFCVLIALAPPFNDEPILPCASIIFLVLYSFIFHSLFLFTTDLCASPTYQDRLSPFCISRASRLLHCLTSLPHSAFLLRVLTRSGSRPLSFTVRVPNTDVVYCIGLLYLTSND